MKKQILNFFVLATLMLSSTAMFSSQTNDLYASLFETEINTETLNDSYREQLLRNFGNEVSEFLGILAHPTSSLEREYVYVSGNTVYITFYYNDWLIGEYTTKIAFRPVMGKFIGRVQVLQDGAFMPAYGTCDLLLDYIKEEIRYAGHDGSQAIEATELILGKDMEYWNCKDMLVCILNAGWIMDGYWDRY